MSGEDHIVLAGLRVLGRHGALPEEAERSQPFEIDLDIELDAREAGAHDDLSLTIDYGTVVARVKKVVEEESFQLLEALAEAVAATVLLESRASAVTVEVRKLRPPVPADLAFAAVRLRRPKKAAS